MPTLILTPKTQRGEAVLDRYGDEWLITEDRHTTITVTDLDERHSMRLPNAHFDIKEHRT